MSLEGSLSHPPPVVFVEPVTTHHKCGSSSPEAAGEQRQPAGPVFTPTPQPLATASGDLASGGEFENAAHNLASAVDNGLQPLEEDGDAKDDEENEEEEEMEWGLPVADTMEQGLWSGLPRKGGGEMFARTDMRNFNYDVIVDFVNQGR